VTLYVQLASGIADAMVRANLCLAVIAPTNRFEHPLTRFGIIDERVTLRPMDELEVLGFRAAED